MLFSTLTTENLTLQAIYPILILLLGTSQINKLFLESHNHIKREVKLIHNGFTTLERNHQKLLSPVYTLHRL